MSVHSVTRHPNRGDAPLQLSQLTIMRRANGDLFAVRRKGRALIALWPSLQSALRYKARNPELLVFLPALAASPFGRKSLAALQEENTGLFLLTGTGGAQLADGHEIEWKEINTETVPY